MRERKRLDPVGTDPILVPLETDVRLTLRLDVSRLLQDGGVDCESGEPSAEELLAFVRATLERYLQAQAHIVDARVTWLDGEMVGRRDGLSEDRA